MYYIYLDEAYNLTPGATKQLIVLGGFGTTEPKQIAKAYKRIRKFTLKKRQLPLEIKSFDKVAVKIIIPKVFRALVGLDVVIYAIRQDKIFIPHQFYQKDKLNYEKVYLHLLIRLLRDEWKLKNHKSVSVVLDYFPTKNIAQSDLINCLFRTLKDKYPEKFFKIRFADSAGDFNLQVADFIVGSFFKTFQNKGNAPDFNDEGIYMRIIHNIFDETPQRKST